MVYSTFSGGSVELDFEQETEPRTMNDNKIKANLYIVFVLEISINYEVDN